MNRIKYGKVYVWKDEKIIKACFVYPHRKSYIVLNDDNKTNEQINVRISGWKDNGFDVLVGPPPVLEIVKDMIIDAKFKDIT